jgi:hypothetical protein
VSDEPVHNPRAIFAALEEHQVAYVTVGGLAVAAWAYERATKDTDVIVPTTDAENDQRLTAALSDLGARQLELNRSLGGEAAWQEIDGLDRWRTTGGILDVMRDVEGAAPFPDLHARSMVIDTDGVRARYVGVHDLIAMKVAAGRPQDLIDLSALLARENQQSNRARLRELDCRLLATGTEPRLGDPVDPCEREVDRLRAVLATTTARPELERLLTARARELRSATDATIRRLAGDAIPVIPQPVSTLTGLARDATALSEAETREDRLLKTRDTIPVWKRSARQQARSESDLEQRTDELRDALATIETWWSQTSTAVTNAIAARRETYRRDRIARSSGEPHAPGQQPPEASPGERPPRERSSPPQDRENGR